jgi:hypothetical protein
MAGKGTTVQITAADVRFLEKRGARSHRGGGPFSRSVVLHRTLQMLGDVLEHSDPRRTRALPEAMHGVVVRVLPEPWNLKAFEVEHLATILERAPGFGAAAAAAGVDSAALLATVAALSFPEKLALLDHALQEQGPGAAAASPEEG